MWRQASFFGLALIAPGAGIAEFAGVKRIRPARFQAIRRKQPTALSPGMPERGRCPNRADCSRVGEPGRGAPLRSSMLKNCGIARIWVEPASRLLITLLIDLN